MKKVDNLIWEWIIAGILWVIFTFVFNSNFMLYMWLPLLLIASVHISVKKKEVFDAVSDKTDHIKIVSKTTKVSGGKYSTDTKYFVAIEFSDKRRVNIKIDVNIYNTLVENETGTLVYRESDGYTWWIDFIRD